MSELKVSIGESRLPNAGKGLFATENFKRGERIATVTGERYTAEDVEVLHSENDYLLEINDNTGDCIEVSGAARYANDAKGTNAIPGMVNNAQFCSDEDNSMYIEATRRITKGQEILVNYGKTYWKHAKQVSLYSLATL